MTYPQKNIPLLSLPNYLLPITIYPIDYILPAFVIN
jgi:hypothetical protein